MTWLHTLESKNSSVLRITNFEVWSIFGAQRLQHSALLKREVPRSHTVKLHCPLQPSQSKMRENRLFPSTLWILLEAAQPSAITETGENGQIGDFTSMIPLDLGNFRPGFSSHFSFKPNEIFKQRLMDETIKRQNKKCMLAN